MHIMKRQILTIACLIAALTFWTGCGGGDETSNEAAIAEEVEEGAAAEHSETEAERMAREAKAKAEEMAREAKAEAEKAAEALNK